MRKAGILSAILGVVLAVPATAQVALTPQISGDSLTAKIQLPGGVAADLSINFEQVVGLNVNALGLSATLVNPSDAALLSRLPDGTLIAIPAAFPVLVRVEPTPSSGLSFSGIYKLSLYTHALTLVTNSPLRLFRAPAGGAFSDMTASLEVGSVRAGGSGPGFSDFLIVADSRPSAVVIPGKFDVLQNLLTAHSGAINPAVAQGLQQNLDQARGFYAAGALSAAIDAVTAFSDKVKKQSGANIPDVWTVGGSAVNVAGLLRSAADTLRFSLVAKNNGAP